LAISSQPDNSPIEGQLIVQSAATSSEVRFSPAALEEYRALLERYPARQAALLPTLWIAQREFGWISPTADGKFTLGLVEMPGLVRNRAGASAQPRALPQKPDRGIRRAIYRRACPPC
jgi:hypothetical protein